MTVTLQLTPELEARLRDRAVREGLDPDTFAVGVLAKALGPTNSIPSEGELLGRLDLGFSPELWARYRSLVEKRRDESITEDERSELLALTARLETANVRRMEAAAELARVRGKSLEQTVKELGIGPVGEPYDE